MNASAFAHILAGVISWEVGAILAAAEVAGGTVVKPAADTFWGGHGGYFADPDGHAWEVSFNPFWPLLADGSVQLPDSR